CAVRLRASATKRTRATQSRAVDEALYGATRAVFALFPFDRRHGADGSAISNDRPARSSGALGTSKAGGAGPSASGWKVVGFVNVDDFRTRRDDSERSSGGARGGTTDLHVRSARPNWRACRAQCGRSDRRFPSLPSRHYARDGRSPSNDSFIE